ncbi:MAG: hypothetical protein IT385_19980 [Deltaproteobacteria bacterium]|nr:hypothetical protein [Deltaproteobacteria bacterium]
MVDRLPFPPPLPASLPGLVVKGLAFWRRPLLELARSEYLGSIAREAGLPPRVLQREGTRIRSFIQAIIADLRDFSSVRADVLARREAHRLPARLDNPTFLGMATELALAARAIATRLGPREIDTTNLDRVAPDWRAAFPLLLDDEAALALVTGLVSEARRAPTPRPLRVVVRLSMTSSGELTLGRHLALPATLARAGVAELFGLQPEDLPPRFDLVATSDGAPPRVVAIVSSRAAGDAFHVEPLIQAAVDHHLDRALVLVMRAQGRIVGRYVPPGGQALSPLPWVFSLEASGEYWRLAAQGAASFVDRCRVLASADFVPQPACRPTGEVAGRALYELTETTKFGRDDDAVAITLGERMSEHAFEWVGRRLAEDDSVFVGMPRLACVHASGERRLVSDTLEARSAAGWGPLTASHIGHFDVRLCTQRGIEMVDRIRVVPADLRVELTPVGPHKARLTLNAADPPELGIDPTQPGITSVSHLAPGSAEVEGTSDLVDFALRLRWSRGETAMRLPLPRSGRGFVTARGTPLGHDARIALDALHTVAAQGWIHPSTDKRLLALEVALRAEDATQAPVTLAHLEPGRHGRHALPLYALARQLERILALSTSPGAELHVRILDEAGSSRGAPRLVIARFSDTLTLDKGRAHGPTDTTFEALSLAEPDRVVRLPVEVPGVASTEVLDGQPGAWIIMARRGDRIVTAPRLRMVTGPSGLSSALRRVVDLPTFAERRDGFVRALAVLAESPDDPDWTLVQRYLAHLDRFPLTTFEALRTLPAAPRALVRALLGSSYPEAVVRAFEAMPFHWSTLPCDALVHAMRVEHARAEALWQQVRHIAGVTRAGLSTPRLIPARDALAARYPGMSVLFAAAAREVPDLSPSFPCQELDIAAVMPDALTGALARAAEDLRKRHPVLELLPRLDALAALRRDVPPPVAWSEALKPHRIDVALSALIEAPLLAALVSMHPTRRATPAECVALRHAESIDPHYFVEAHQVGLTLAAARRGGAA